MPKFIQNSKAVLNIQNNDEFCFLWSIVAALKPQTINACRTSSYPSFREVLKYEGISLPIKLRHSDV